MDGIHGLKITVAMVVGLILPCMAFSAGPFTFIYGMELQDADEFLHTSRRLGLNTIYLDLIPSDLDDTAQIRRIARHAGGFGFKVIVGLPTTTFTDIPVSPYSEKYPPAAREMIEQVITALKSERAIDAWATGHMLEKHIHYNNEDFRTFLQRRYPSLDQLNGAWGGSFKTWMSVTQNAGLAANEANVFGAGQAALDVADYRKQAFEDVMAQWAGAIRAHDPDRPIMTGMLSLYRSIPSVPDSYDIISVRMPPEIMAPQGEEDQATHNVHAVDMARRGGRFDVVTTLRLPLADLGRVNGWIQEADLHGATGVGFENWDRLKENAYLTRLLAPQLTRQWPQSRFQGSPRPSAAILYTPYAEGYQVVGVPVYGYLKDFSPREPTSPIEDLRLGTCFGTVDVITPADLAYLDLSRYSLLICPSAIGLQSQHCRMLAKYVENGGALIADIGLGLRASGSWVKIPEALVPALGFERLLHPGSRAGNLRVSTRVPELPSLRVGMESEGTFRIHTAQSGDTVTSRAGTYAVSSPCAYAPASKNTPALAVMDAKPTEGSSGQPQPTPGMPGQGGLQLQKPPGQFCGLLFNRHGAGSSVFATHRLYPYWPLSDPMNAALHYDLMRRRARAELLNTPFLPDSVEMAWEGDRLRLLNPADREQTYSVRLYGMGDRLAKDALNVTTAGSSEKQQQQLVVATVAGQTTASIGFAQITAQPYAAEVSTLIRSLQPGGIGLLCAGPGAQLRHGRGGVPQFTRPDAVVTVRVSITDSPEYPVRPGSEHTVTISRRRGETETFPVTAREGTIIFGTEVYRDTIQITPAG